MVPTMISAVLDHPRLKEFDLSSLETIFYGASPITPTRLRQGIAQFGPIFFQFYGQAEAMTTVTVMRRDEHDLSSDERLSSCRSEEHTSELQSLMRISYAVFCLKKKQTKHKTIIYRSRQTRMTQ